MGCMLMNGRCNAVLLPDVARGLYPKVAALALGVRCGECNREGRIIAIVWEFVAGVHFLS